MHPFALQFAQSGETRRINSYNVLVERYENLYIFVQQKSRSTSGFSCIGAILDCYGGISTLPNGYRGCWHLVSVAQLQLTLPCSMLDIKKRLPQQVGQPRKRAIY